MFNHITNVEFNLQGIHKVTLAPEQFWQSLNDPSVLQDCLRGCKSVTQHSPEEYTAIFSVRVGPLKKLISAKLEIVEKTSISHYQLKTNMHVGIFGTVKGHAEVSLEQLPDRSTRLSYIAHVTASGFLARLGTKVLESSAENYLNQFFDKLIAEKAESGLKQ